MPRPITIRRAFTLIELLVVVAIIAMLIGILLPALAKARLAAQKGVSASNLSSLAKVQSGYASEFRDSFVNPFDARTGTAYQGFGSGSGAVEWYHVIMPQSSQAGATSIWAFNFGFDARCTEAFSSRWGWYMANYTSTQTWESGLAYLRDPADSAINLRAKRLQAAAAASGVEAIPYDTSYWYPPLFWLGAERYASETLQPIDKSPAIANADVRVLRRNRFDQVSFAENKVMLFERFDAGAKSRPSGTPAMSADGPPQWNNPAARPQVAFVDGSVARISMGSLHVLGESNASSESAKTFRPSGFFNLSAAYLQYFQLFDSSKGDTDAYETGMSPFAATTTAWRQYFYATRNGIKGRDVQGRK